jgi:hypothetical protein
MDIGGVEQAQIGMGVCVIANLVAELDLCPYQRRVLSDVHANHEKGGMDAVGAQER